MTEVGTILLGLSAQIEESAAAGGGLAVVDLVRGAGPVVKLVLLVLLLFSLFSWAIMVYKLISLNRARRAIFEFSRRFWSVSDGQELKLLLRSDVNPASRIVVAALRALDRSGGNPQTAAVERATRQAVSEEIALMERFVPFLATVGNISPFVGLFGTVWGIMRSFHEIGKVGSASLAVVAPGISEALIATALGLFAAIPAVMGYNYFTNKIRLIGTELDGFNADLINAISSGEFPPR